MVCRVVLFIHVGISIVSSLLTKTCTHSSTLGGICRGIKGGFFRDIVSALASIIWVTTLTLLAAFLVVNAFPGFAIGKKTRWNWFPSAVRRVAAVHRTARLGLFGISLDASRA